MTEVRGWRRVALMMSTARRLGIGNIAIVAGYRIAKARGWLDLKVMDVSLKAPLFRRAVEGQAKVRANEALSVEAAALRSGMVRSFGSFGRPVGNPPDWSLNLLSGVADRDDRVWWRQSDGAAGRGDVKGLWEASRFDWALVLARSAVAFDNLEDIDLLNQWILDWSRACPAYSGIQWLCGQEASIRLLHVLLALRLLGQDGNPEPGMIHFAERHLARIARTRLYAMAQDNNHGVSEAAALFVGGAWLARVSSGASARKGRRWERIGRFWLNNRVDRLIFPDGGFSQYSVTYHRLMLDTLVQVETWCRRLQCTAFPKAWHARIANAADWLAALTHPASGEAPNLGANDGAWPYRLHALGPRDFRPTVQVATTVFSHARRYPTGPWDEVLEALEILPRAPKAKPLPPSQLFPDFGLVRLSASAAGSSYGFARVPRRQFRPHQADGLHFDLWSAEGVNLLRDAGSGSYSDPAGVEHFASTAGHNSVEFDGRDAMPRLSRFLYGQWLNGMTADPEQRPDGSLRWWGSYRDAYGAEHRRDISVCGDEWTVVDTLGGRYRTARLRWRLAPDCYVLMGSTLHGSDLSITITAGATPDALRLVQAREARGYGRWDQIPCLEIAVTQDVRSIETRIRVETH